MKPALFLDRDGVINHETHYLYRKEEVLWVDGIFSLVRTAREHGFVIVVVTNQAGIGRGFYTEDDFHALMAWMQQAFVAQGGALDAVYFSPYHPEKGIGEYRRDHPDRKPNPGMLLRAAADLGLDLKRSILVGDRSSDIAAANAAGLEKAFLLAGTESTSSAETHEFVRSLSEVERWIRER